MGGALPCPVCGVVEESRAALAEHLVAAAGDSDPRHVMWLNRNVTRHRVTATELAPLLDAALSGRGGTGDRVRR